MRVQADTELSESDVFVFCVGKQWQSGPWGSRDVQKKGKEKEQKYKPNFKLSSIEHRVNGFVCRVHIILYLSQYLIMCFQKTHKIKQFWSRTDERNRNEWHEERRIRESHIIWLRKKSNKRETKVEKRKHMLFF